MVGTNISTSTASCRRAHQRLHTHREKHWFLDEFVCLQVLDDEDNIEVITYSDLFVLVCIVVNTVFIAVTLQIYLQIFCFQFV